MPNVHPAVQKVIDFLRTDIWRISSSDLSRSKALFLKPVRIAVLTLRGYVLDNCALRASSLTFYSLLAVVPVVALAFGIAKGFGLEQGLEKQLYLHLAGQEEVLERIIAFSRSLLENTKGGVIAGIGVAVLFWSAIKVLSHIEGSLNKIWKVKSRSFIRKFTDYLTIMIISPLLVIISSSVNVYITTQVTTITSKLALLQIASPLIFMMLKLLPFGLIWLLFILIYMVMPNTHVRFRSALIAGIIGGTIFQLAQGSYIHLQVLLARYNAIYGSFAALPFFLIWLQVSWMIVLFGAQIAYTHQHVQNGAMAVDYESISPGLRKQYALLILRHIVQRFEKGDPPMTSDQIAQTLMLPFSLVTQTIDLLIESRLVSTVSDQLQNGATYQPARDIQGISMTAFLGAWDQTGNNHPLVQSNEGLAKVARALDAIGQEVEQSPSNKLVKAI